jgi:threonyl-tRNA synthetase
LFGSIERFFGILVEHYAGAFPAWLAPVQVAAIPISADQVPYLEELAERLRAEGVRVEVYDSDDRMQRKIREAQKAKVPFMVLAGEKDVAQHSVSFRYRNGQQRNFVPVDEAVAQVVDFIRSRDNRDPSPDTVPAAAQESGLGL